MTKNSPVEPKVDDLVLVKDCGREFKCKIAAKIDSLYLVEVLNLEDQMILGTHAAPFAWHVPGMKERFENTYTAWWVAPSNLKVIS